jgi:inverse autotransporter-like protein with beta domain
MRKYSTMNVLIPCMRTLTVCIFVFIVSFSGALFASETKSNTTGAKWIPWAELGGYYGSDTDSRAEMTLFSPLTQSEDTLTFLDFRFKYFEKQVNEFNLALGRRHMLENKWNIGIWGGIDRRRSELGNDFFQVATGVEALHSDWDFRINGYYPLSNPDSSSSEVARIELSGNQIHMIGGAEVPLYGADIEVGFRVPIEHLFNFSSGNTKHDLRVYAGAFYFDHKDAIKDISGPKARIAWQFNNLFEKPGTRLTLEAEYSNDDVRDNHWEAGIRFRIPISFSDQISTGRMLSLGHQVSLNKQEQRMMDRLERDTDIVVGLSKAEPVVDDLTGAFFNHIASVDASTNVQGTIDSTGQNSLIVAQGTNGNINTNVALQSNQTLMSGGTTIQVRGANSGTTTTFTASGSQAVITHAANSPAITMNNNTHVAGMHMVGGAGGGNVGIFGTGISNVFVTGNSIDNFGGTGISLSNLSSGTCMITQNVVLNAGADGIRAGSANDGTFTVDISGNRIENSALDGIQITNFDNSHMDLKVSSNIVNNIGADSMRLDLQNNSSLSFVIAYNSFSNSPSDGLEFDIENNSSAVGSIHDNQIASTTFGEGIEIDQDQSSSAIIRIYNNNIINSFADPLDLDLDDNAIGRYQVYNNSFNSPQPASIVDIDTNDNAFLGLQVYANTSNVNLDFDEDGASTFEVEDTLNSNTLTGGASFVIDPLINIVPAGTYFPVP